MVSMDEALRIKAEMEGEWLDQPGVTGVDVGLRSVGGEPTEEPVIRIYVGDRRQAEEHLRLPKVIRGVPVEIIERRFELY
jgi:hypothetical protein